MTCFDNHSGYHASTFPPHTIAAAAAEQAEFRTLARTWLRGDMAKYKAFMTQSTSAQLGVRDATALAKLPADDQKALTQLCQRLSKGISRVIRSHGHELGSFDLLAIREKAWSKEIT